MEGDRWLDRPEAGTRVPPCFTGRVVAVHRAGAYAAGWTRPAGVVEAPGLSWFPGPAGGGEAAGPGRPHRLPRAFVVVAVGDRRWPPGPWHLRLPLILGDEPAGWRAWLAPGVPVAWGAEGGVVGSGPRALPIPPPSHWQRWTPPRGPQGPAPARRQACAVLGHLLAVARRPGWEPVAGRVAAVWRSAAAGRWDAASSAALDVLGAGPGLTPSGDDWLAGWTAYWAWRSAGSGGFDRWAGAIREAACRRTGPVSRALLEGALAGELPEPAAGLLAALWTGRAAAVPGAARRLLRVGHSSGVDLAWGLWMAARLDGATGPGARAVPPRPV